jgi:flagellar biosynthesis protein FlhA
MESVAIKDLRTILESLTEVAAIEQNPVNLTIHVRAALGRTIVQSLASGSDELKVITFEPTLEQLLLQAAQGSAEGQLAIEPTLAERLHTTLKEESQKIEIEGDSAILLVAPQIRAQLAKLFKFSLPSIHILAYSEIPENRKISVVANIGQES